MLLENSYDKLFIKNNNKLKKYFLVSVFLHFFIIGTYYCLTANFSQSILSNTLNDPMKIYVVDDSNNQKSKSPKEKEKKVILKHQENGETLVKEKKEKQDNKKENNQAKEDSNNQEQPKKINPTVKKEQETIIKSQFVTNIQYSILAQENPNYPAIAYRLGFRKKVIIKTRLLIGLNGEVLNIEFLNKENNSIIDAFKKEVASALTKWQFSPVKIDNKLVKMYFYKDFHFIP